MAATKWSKKETCAVIQQYDKFPELCNITSPEYRNKGFKMSKIKEISELGNFRYQNSESQC